MSCPPPSTQTELHTHSELSLRGGSVSDVRLQSQQILRGSHPGPLAVRTLLRFGDESESTLHPGGVAHKPARGLRHAQPGVLRLRHPGGNGERCAGTLQCGTTVLPEIVLFIISKSGLAFDDLCEVVLI